MTKNLGWRWPWPAAGPAGRREAAVGSGGSGASDEAFDTPAQVLANEAETLYREGKYDESANLFQALKDRFPYSRFALLADLRVGDAYFKSKRYEEAVLAYEDFIRLHPKNDAVPYAIYQMGMVYFDQMLTPDRDPENARKAMQTFQRLIKQYPQSEWAVRCPAPAAGGHPPPGGPRHGGGQVLLPHQGLPRGHGPLQAGAHPVPRRGAL